MLAVATEMRHWIIVLIIDVVSFRQQVKPNAVSFFANSLMRMMRMMPSVFADRLNIVLKQKPDCCNDASIDRNADALMMLGPCLDK